MTESSPFNPDHITIGDCVFFRTSQELFSCEHLKGMVNDIVEKDGQKHLTIWTINEESRRFEIPAHQALAVIEFIDYDPLA